MRERPEDLDLLQRRLDESHAAAGDHLRTIFSEDHRPTAPEVVDHLVGVIEVHLACVTGAGAPVVAPIDAIFFRGLWWVGFPAPSVRARLVRRDPRISISSNERGMAVIVHGTVQTPDDETNAAYLALMRELYVAQYGPGWLDWHAQLDHRGDVGGYVEPRRIFARRA